MRLWKRGADPLTAPAMFETGSESNGVNGYVDRIADSEAPREAGLFSR